MTPDPHVADLRLAELAFKAEALARYCLRRLFTVLSLWPHFTDDVALEAFWKLSATQRTTLWGAQMDVVTEFAHFNRTTAAIQLDQ
jgi:hypothetical protein